MVYVRPSDPSRHIRSAANDPLNPSFENDLRASLARLSGLCPVVMRLYVLALFVNRRQFL
jgi:hypothetical protein